MSNTEQRVWVIEWRLAKRNGSSRWIPMNGEMFINYRPAVQRRRELTEQGRQVKITAYQPKPWNGASAL